MGALLLLGLPLTFVFASFAVCCAAYAFFVGMEAASHAKRYHDARSLLCVFLAVTLCEALVNAVLLPMIVFGFNYSQNLSATPLRSTLFLTAPMLVLGLPILGMRASNSTCRRQSLVMLGVSLLRWAIVISAWATLFSWSYTALVGLALPNLMLISGGLVLWKYARWGRQLLQDYQHAASARFAPRTHKAIA